jgi:hypothetical protein
VNWRFPTDVLRFAELYRKIRGKSLAVSIWTTKLVPVVFVFHVVLLRVGRLCGGILAGCDADRKYEYRAQQ